MELAPLLIGQGEVQGAPNPPEGFDDVLPPVGDMELAPLLGQGEVQGVPNPPEGFDDLVPPVGDVPAPPVVQNAAGLWPAAQNAMEEVDAPEMFGVALGFDPEDGDGAGGGGGDDDDDFWTHILPLVCCVFFGVLIWGGQALVSHFAPAFNHDGPAGTGTALDLLPSSPRTHTPPMAAPDTCHPWGRPEMAPPPQTPDYGEDWKGDRTGFPCFVRLLREAMAICFGWHDAEASASTTDHDPPPT
ncbi:hypothetical protein ACP70R_030378 [Stipagrostis hirtigluma subsp. patula]